MEQLPVRLGKAGKRRANPQCPTLRLPIHLLHYVPGHRGKDFDVLEDVIPLYNLPVSVQSAKKDRQVTLVPQHTPFKYEQKGNRIEFTLPEPNGRQMIAVQG